MMLRLGGMGAIAGGVLWALGFIGGNMDESRLGLWFSIAAIGSLGLLLALIGLSAFQARRSPRLAWAAFVIPAAGTLVSVLGMFGLATRSSEAPMVLGLAPWEIWIIGLFALVLGSILFAVTTLQTEVLSRAAAIALAVTSGAFLVLGRRRIGRRRPAMAAGRRGAGIRWSWVWLGISALRGGPIRAIAAA